MSGGWNTRVRGINEIQKEYRQRYGPGDYVPVVGVTYWAFRLMVGSAGVIILLTLTGLVLVWRRRLESARWFQIAAIASIAFPYVANSAGWIFTEMGRQPWAVQGLLLTRDAVSPGTTAGEVTTSLTGFAVLYAMARLLFLYARLLGASSHDASPACRYRSSIPSRPVLAVLVIEE